MKKTKKLGLILIAITIVMLVTFYTSKHHKSDSISVSNSGSDTSTTNIITITKNKPVEIQIFDGENKANFVVGSMADNTPYICHYNKGMPNQYRLAVPAYKDRKLLGYIPDLSRTGFIKVELTLSEEAPVNTAQLYYIIKRIR